MVAIPTSSPAPFVEIDLDRCVGCGRCVELCPSRALALENERARVVRDVCIGCDHCAAACPTEAVLVAQVAPDTLEFKTFIPDPRWLAPGAPLALDQNGPVSQLVRLMRSRRSCRQYKDAPVARPLLDDLIKIGVTAPSGTSSQRWTFTVLPTRPAVEAAAQAISDFFRKLNRMASKPWLRAAMRLTGKPELEHYYYEYHASVQAALEAYERDGTDKLFHGAPAAILVGSRPGASCPMEDALLATQNILLGAHALGLGSCLIGYAVAAMGNDKKIQRALSIPADEKIHAVIALGHPAQTWERQSGRKTPVVRWFEG